MSSGAQPRQALLLLNLGTPSAPEPEAVGRYLKQFLMDKWVIGAPYLIRWFLVNVLIVPRRKYTSAHAYQSIWTDRGSPLLFHLRDLQAAVQKILPNIRVEVAMRYGEPSIESALISLRDQGFDEITVFPLYPQYAESTTRSSREETERVARELGIQARLRFVKDYYAHPEFISSVVTKIKSQWQNGKSKIEHLLLTFHGLPQSHVEKTDRSDGQHCLVKSDCCAVMCDANRDCYRAQCFSTARAIARELGLTTDQYSVSFQSRLGPTRWIDPYTEDVLPDLAKNGVQHLAVACPSFTSDCLETIEEIGERGREVFLKAGGQEFTLIDCLNSDERWAQAVARIQAEQRK